MTSRWASASSSVNPLWRHVVWKDPPQPWTRTIGGASLSGTPGSGRKTRTTGDTRSPHPDRDDRAAAEPLPQWVPAALDLEGPFSSPPPRGHPSPMRLLHPDPG